MNQYQYAKWAWNVEQQKIKEELQDAVRPLLLKYNMDVRLVMENGEPQSYLVKRGVSETLFSINARNIFFEL